MKHLRLAAVAVCLAVAPAWAAIADAPVECWRGWGYRVDRQTRTYTSQELLLVTKGAAAWQPGQEVALYMLDRASGRLAAQQLRLVIVPLNPRTYYRDNLNYVDGEGEIVGAADNLVFGFSHVPPPTADIEKMYQYNRWACGLESSAN